MPPEPPAPTEPPESPTVPLPVGAAARRRRPSARELAGPVVLPAVLVVLLVGALVAAQVVRPLPAVTVRITAPAVHALPGAAPSLPWPDRGQAVLDIPGVGSPGRSGDGRPTPIGSVAKVMTAYLVLADHPLAAGQDGPSITVTDADVADYRSRIASEQSLVPVAAGERLTERQALQALLLPSANNVAQLLARWDAGTAAAFVTRMNATAQRLGMTGTTYTDPSGFRPDTVSTAADQVVLGERAMALPAFAEIVGQPSARIPVAGEIRNYNTLLGTGGVVGIKTGSTDQAGGNLLFAARLTVAGRTLTVVGAVLNQPGTDTAEQLAAVNDTTTALLGALHQALDVVTVLPADTLVGQARTAWRRTSPIRTDRPVRVVGWPGMPVTVTATTTPPVNVHAGTPLGTLTVQAGTARLTTTARAQHALPHPSTPWRLTRLR
jgi:D-alanyl-D-alanine carboxypeptidase (penicillin-binding protein 5/6)